MSFLENDLGAQSPAGSPRFPLAGPVNYAAFWDWFATQAASFHQVVMSQSNFERDFFDQLRPHLDALRPGYWMLAGKGEGNVAELIITAESNTKNFVFVEELIAAAPEIPNWKFIALKPALDMSQFGVQMGGIEFSFSNINFCELDNPRYPDAIVIAFTHDDYTPENHDLVSQGCFIFLNNYLGEMNTALLIDQFLVVEKAQVEQDLIPVSKLLEYLKWRQAEFVEKYEGVRCDTSNDGYSLLQGTVQSGSPFVALVNQDLLLWDRKASHPWMLVIEIGYDGRANQGLPDPETAAEMDALEDELLEMLLDKDGYLHIGRQTVDHERTIFWACHEFRKPSQILDAIIRGYSGELYIKFSIYRDLYWQTVEHLAPQR